LSSNDLYRQVGAKLATKIVEGKCKQQ
jgi:hypothetical protein